MYRIAIFLLLIPSFARSQTMQGIVTDAVTGRPLYPVIVVNERTQLVATTDDKGFYKIAASPGDGVAFSFIGFLTAEIGKTAADTLMIHVALQPTDYELQEFRLKPSTLTLYQQDSIERLTIYKIPLERTHPNPIMNPVSAIAELFSRRAKTVYRFQETFAAGEVEKFIDSRYSPKLVTQLTGLTGDSIGYFMYEYPMPYDFARTATDLELKMWIRGSFKEWVKNGSVNPFTQKK